jgi:N-acetylmuramoyl-L-alanine amidase
MRWTRRSIINRVVGLPTVLCLLAHVPARAQGTPTFNRDTVVLDPAHGGTDGGARINDHLEEKDVTLALAGRLRSLLAARGFTVVSTREDDLGARSGTPLSTDQRAEMANRAHAVACLVLHASPAGNGIYLGTSALGSPLAAVAQTSSGNPAAPSSPVTWDRAQELYVPQSLGLANQLRTVLSRESLPLASGRVALRPLDNLMCPAVSIEIGPLRVDGSDATPVSDGDYQQRVAEAIAGALIFWKNQAQPPSYLPTSSSTSGPGQ